MYCLFEHCVGYALFKIKEFEEITPTQVPKDFARLAAFHPFKRSNEVLENTLNVSDGNLHPDLELFLETNLPKSSKKNKVFLGVADPKIGSAIQEKLGITCQHTGSVPEIIRNIRFYLAHLIENLSQQTIANSELGCGRNFSRSKVKFNVNRADNMIIQSISLIDQLDRDINTFSMRLREWYSYHFPELVKIVPDNYKYAKIAKLIGNRKEIEEDVMQKLNEITCDESIDKQILDASKSSMGMDISPLDLLNISKFASKIINLTEYRHQLMNYLISRMHNVAPNLATLIGETVNVFILF